MLKKKLVSLCLSLVMLCSLVSPAAAAPAANQRLSAVTTKVKQDLSLDTQSYTSFYGDLSEDLLAPSWYLEWSGEDGSLSISATEEGKVFSYHLRETTEPSPGGVFTPSFPAGDQSAARTAARAFLDKVLTQGETITMEDRPVYLGATSYRFGGEILLHGLPAGLSYSISVRCKDNQILSFSRDDINGLIMDGVPSPHADISVQQAEQSLRQTLSMRLEYVLPENGSKQAVLRYLPEYGDEFYVDASTGELVNLTQLHRDTAKNEAAAGDRFASASAPAPAPEEELSKTEQAGVDKLNGVLARDELDRIARSLSALGLHTYTLSGVDYTVARAEQTGEQPDVTATLHYGRQVEGLSWRRTVILDAKEGHLLQVYSSAHIPDGGIPRTVDVAFAQQAAASFLQDQCARQFAHCALFSHSDALEHDYRSSHSFSFVQKENGYFFPSNCISVGIDATDGSISSYHIRFDEEVTFDSPIGIVSMDQAIDAWLDTYEIQLGYVRIPAAIDYTRPEYKALLDSGISFLYRLKLGYTLHRDSYVSGIDAKSGTAVLPAAPSSGPALSYTDVAGHWGEAHIHRLAQFGIGYSGGSFHPEAQLTQLDLIALLASTEGYHYDPTPEHGADDLYEYAFRIGLLSKAQREDGAILTRAQAVKLILDAAGYGPIAKLEGIFRTKFTDDSDIPPSDHGYVALAQGLGMVTGHPGDHFLPDAPATRAQAAVMLCQLMAR